MGAASAVLRGCRCCRSAGCGAGSSLAQSPPRGPHAGAARPAGGACFGRPAAAGHRSPASPALRTASHMQGVSLSQGVFPLGYAGQRPVSFLFSIRLEHLQDFRDRRELFTRFGCSLPFWLLPDTHAQSASVLMYLQAGQNFCLPCSLVLQTAVDAGAVLASSCAGEWTGSRGHYSGG